MQALYQRDLCGEDFDAESFLSESAKDEETRAHAEDLLAGCLARQDELDARIAEAAEHWDVKRMASVDRAILRLGVYELLHRPDVPPKVALDEAIRLAKKYGGAESGGFVNGILDRIMKQVRPPDVSSKESP